MKPDSRYVVRLQVIVNKAGEDTPMSSTVQVWEGLDYKALCFVERHLVNSLLAMNKESEEQYDKL